MKREIIRSILWVWFVAGIALMVLSVSRNLAHGQGCEGGQCPSGQCEPQPIWQQQPIGGRFGEYAQREQQQQANQEPPPSAIVKVCVEGKPSNGRQSQSWGTGTIVAVDGGVVVLTCYHTFRDDQQGRITITIPGGATSEGRLMGVDQEEDLAAVAVAYEAVKSIQPYRIAANPPTQGEALWLGGYADGKIYHGGKGRLIGYLSSRPGASERWQMKITGGSQQGDSGGPIINVRGELVGVLAATDGSVTIGACNTRIHHFLGRLFPRNRRPQPGVIVQLPGQQPNQQPAQQAPSQPAPLPQPLPPQSPTDVPAPQTPTVDLTTIQQQIAALQDAIAKIPAGPQGIPGKDGLPGKDGQDGQDGPQGTAGKDGTNGRDGKDGVSPALDYQAIAAEVVKQLPPQKTEWIDSTGKVIASQSAPLGQALRFRLVPEKSTPSATATAAK